mmetsp:Transcript_3302/g.11298  ORF Transcript_3302/g.11298 Transcript_3302/m.11298 type:complete len:252 (+) Transcript_3302:2457-3212(+)
MFCSFWTSQERPWSFRRAKVLSSSKCFIELMSTDDTRFRAKVSLESPTLTRLHRAPTLSSWSIDPERWDSPSCSSASSVSSRSSSISSLMSSCKLGLSDLPPCFTGGRGEPLTELLTSRQNTSMITSLSALSPMDLNSAAALASSIPAVPSSLQNSAIMARRLISFIPCSTNENFSAHDRKEATLWNPFRTASISSACTSSCPALPCFPPPGGSLVPLAFARILSNFVGCGSAKYTGFTLEIEPFHIASSD